MISINWKTLCKMFVQGEVYPHGTCPNLIGFHLPNHQKIQKYTLQIILVLYKYLLTSLRNWDKNPQPHHLAKSQNVIFHLILSQHSAKPKIGSISPIYLKSLQKITIKPMVKAYDKLLSLHSIQKPMTNYYKAHGKSSYQNSW